jgi:hypothetical protein
MSFLRLVPVPGTALIITNVAGSGTQRKKDITL